MTCPFHSVLVIITSTLLTEWKIVLREKLTVPQMVKKFPHFMDPVDSLLHS